MYVIEWVTQAYTVKGNPSADIRSRTKDLSVTSSDTLSLSYKRLVEAKAIQKMVCYGGIISLKPAFHEQKKCIKCSVSHYEEAFKKA